MKTFLQFAEKQKWASLSPWLGGVSLIAIVLFIPFTTSIFWSMLLVPLYFFHQTEEYVWPGGYKAYMNQKIYDSEDGKEYLTDKKIFWVNMLLGWVPFIALGILSFENIGCGIALIVLTIMNVIVHVFHTIRQKEMIPGMVTSIVQLIVCGIAGYTISLELEEYVFVWWSDSLFFVGIGRLLAYKLF